MKGGLRFAWRMITSRLSGRPTLLLAYLYVTDRCNLRCTYCNFPFLNRPELNTDQCLLVVDQLAALGCRRVTILGGEPLLRADISEIIARVRQRGMACVLTSNGMLVATSIDKLRALSTLVLSLDSVGPANDAVRGAGVFDAVLNAIITAERAGIPVKVNAVLSAKTAPLLDELLAFADEHDLFLTASPMRTGAPDLCRNAETIKAGDDEIRRTLERLAEISRTNRRLLFSPATYRYAAAWGEYTRDRFEVGELPATDVRIRDAPTCWAGRYFMTIQPDGTVYPCVATVRRIAGGNVVTDGVAAAWRRLHDHRCVACYSPCTVEQNMLFSLRPGVLWHFVARHLRRFA